MDMEDKDISVVLTLYMPVGPEHIVRIWAHLVRILSSSPDKLNKPVRGACGACRLW